MEDISSLREVQTSLAVLIATTTRMEAQLAQQNGHLRADHDLIKENSQKIRELCEDRNEIRKLLKEHNEKLHSVEITLASRLMTGGAGGAIVAVLWAVANYLTTGSVTP